MLMEMCEWKQMPFTGGLLEQPESLMEDVLGISLRVAVLKEAKEQGTVGGAVDSLSRDSRRDKTKAGKGRKPGRAVLEDIERLKQSGKEAS